MELSKFVSLFHNLKLYYFLISDNLSINYNKNKFDYNFPIVIISFLSLSLFIKKWTKRKISIYSW